ncbi:dnaJ homolog subfamily C member 12 isoform X1 [Pteropus medius]|uniref:dnaJ homolog subfamily C member 12 isoform X1 n=1 Tax=Pteropus vampyrus TaxID=132908 RepID=UPI00196AE0DF|nr:dnaJ homolog subfamily C member 12 isoform X1 [Pteropus giganteus]
MDAILNYRLEDTEDYYMLLGCDELASVEQILAEFKVRALECHPDKHPENSKAVETFQKLQKAKEILTNEESRARYDHWRKSQITMPFQQWETLSDSVKMSMHWAVKGKKDLMLKESDQTHTNKFENEEWNEQREIKKEELGSTTEKIEQKESESLEKSFSPQNPDSSSKSSHIALQNRGGLSLAKVFQMRTVGTFVFAGLGMFLQNS